jgi:pimeloyl-ACP methyl ester carboxylesterase
VRTVTSKDGTTIAFEKIGQGPALIMVVGAFNDRTTAVPLSQLLKPHFTLFNYDRRGRGDSSDTPPYAVEHEIEDLDALIQEADGSAFVFGYSSGAVLAMRAAASGLAIKKLALYDPPPTGPWAGNLAAQLAELIAAGRRGEAVELFQTDGVGIPRDVVIGMRNAPFRPALEKMAHTLVNEMTILTDETLPPKVAATVKTPTLIMVGANNPEVMRNSGQAFAAAIPGSQYRMLEGQTHDISPDTIAPLLKTFFAN